MSGIRHLIPPWLSSLTPYQPGKPIEEVEREYGIKDSIKLASNENPLGPSPKALVAVARALPDLHRYPDGGCFVLKQEVAKALGVEPAEVLFGNGSNEILELVARAFLRPGDEAVFSEQAFVVYASVVQAAAGVAKAVPLRDFTHDLDAIAAAITRHTRVVFLANPNNPTGTIYRRAAFERFLAALPRDVIVVADEAYFEYVEDPEYPDSLAYRAPGRLLVTCRTFSKIHGLAGLRLGYAVAPAEVVDLLNRVRQPFNVNSLAQVAAIAALGDGEHVAASRAANSRGKRRLLEAFAELGLASVPTEANFVLVDVGNGPAVTEALVRRGVIVRPMGGYGFPRHVRVTIGTEAENERFAASLAEVLRERKD